MNPEPDVSSTGTPPPPPPGGALAPVGHPLGVLVRRAVVVLVPVHLAASLCSLSADTTVATSGVIVNLLLFALGLVGFVAAFLVAAGRSRHEFVWFGGAFLLTGGSVAASDRRVFHAAIAAQIVIAFVIAGVRPFTSAAFAVLAVLAPFALTAWFGSRHGHFPPRPDAG